MEHTSPPSGPRIVRFTEPTEAAFSLLLPEGWHVEGGVARGTSEPRHWYRVLSPGRGAELRRGKPGVENLARGVHTGQPPTPGRAGVGHAGQRTGRAAQGRPGAPVPSPTDRSQLAAKDR